MSKSKYVWYASYGSNLDRDRFLCYIQGGKPKGSLETETGCADRTPPQKDETVHIPYPIYFAEKAGRWDNQGVAFIGLDIDEQCRTLGRMYLISDEQFKDVVKQENNGNEMDIPLDQVIQKGSLKLKETWYGNIVYLGDHEGYPIFTFTAYWNIGEVPMNQPASQYLDNFIRGLSDKYQLNTQELIEYFIDKPGIKGEFSTEQLEKMIQTALDTN